ncbi:MAG: ABC-F family ATP-binding cassette domain-containing protein [Candidatus Staskawiczbacteria bacterium]|nr:ABC-F family ATP-binding cassette domain-containing protein [Candidatus Staskawiczbacteria bacterium]
MRNITAKAIQKSFAGKVVLAGVSFSLTEGKRSALVGENGSGKSTLLKIITGKLEADEGEVFGLENGCAYIAQDFSGDEEETPHDFLCRHSTSVHEAVKLLRQSGFDLGEHGERLKQVKCSGLSGGEKKKLEIAAGLASGSLFIAMDEPENHLDYKAIEWLIGALSKFRGGLIFVSHNQYFIDQLSDAVIELENGSITVYSMKYNEYLTERERQISGRARDWVSEEKTIKRIRKSLEMMKMRAKRNSGTSATYQQAKRRLGDMEESHGQRPSAEANKPKVRLSPDVDQKKGKLIVSVDHVDFAYGTKQVFASAIADLRFGEKVVLFGQNGSGKSTLIRLITGELTPQNGFAKIGVNVRWQFMTQDHLLGVDSSKSALEVFGGILKWPEGKCRAYLARYGIDAGLITRPLKVLSGGQQARFKLALTFAQEPEFLILDEPTNHVDNPTWEAIVESIQGYSGTVLAVTHDREFIEAIAKKLWVLEDHKIRIELGSISDYLDRKV